MADQVKERFESDSQHYAPGQQQKLAVAEQVKERFESDSQRSVEQLREELSCGWPS